MRETVAFLEVYLAVTGKKGMVLLGGYVLQPVRKLVRRYASAREQGYGSRRLRATTARRVLKSVALAWSCVTLRLLRTSGGPIPNGQDSLTDSKTEKRCLEAEEGSWGRWGSHDPSLPL